MKKVFALILALVLVLSLAACGEKKESGTDKSNEKIVAYMEENGDLLIESMESSFATSSGMTCRSSFEVVGNGIVITVCINELEDLDDETKEAIQEAYEEITPTLEPALEMLQEEVPELEYLTVRVCEKDGDLLAEMKVGK